MKVEAKQVSSEPTPVKIIEDVTISSVDEAVEGVLLDGAIESMDPEMLDAANKGESLIDVLKEGVEKISGAEIELTTQPVATPQLKVQVVTPTFTDSEIAEELDIRNFGTLVTLQTSRWHGKVKDRRAALDAAAASGADAGAFEATKRLLVGADEMLKRIHKAIDTARTKHYAMTLPWSTSGSQAFASSGKRTGARLLPNTLFMEYTQAMAKAKGEMDTAINAFVPAYPSLVQMAQKRLGTRFDQSEYPNASAIRERFSLSFDFSPVPMGGDFQGLADAQVERLADRLNAKTSLMLENAMQDAWTRLYDTVTHAYAKFSNPDAMFHYTMVDKLRESADLLKHLNIVNDPTIESVRAYVEKNLTMHDVKEIRKDDSLRKHLASHAKIAVDMMEGATP